ncbi:hypothetical protein QQ045_025258 [Rhodiola kirilowii]
MASLPQLPTAVFHSSHHKPRNSVNLKLTRLKELPANDKGSNQNLYLDYFHRVSALCKDSKIKGAVDLVTELELKDHIIGPEFYGELLQGCVYERALFTGQQIHGRIFKNGEFFSKNEYIETKLVIFYAKCDVLDVAKRLFDRLGCINVFSWAAVIGLYCRMGDCNAALTGFCEMLDDGFMPDNFVIPNALKACGGLGVVNVGRGVHGFAMKLGYGDCVYVASSLVDMYGKCGLLGDARKVFDEMSERNVIVWNSMIVGYAQNGLNEDAVKLLIDMRMQDVEPTRVTVSSFLSASASLDLVKEGKQGHALAVLCGLDLDYILSSSLINFYGKVGLVDDAEIVFSKSLNKDIVNWNLLVSCYVQCGAVEKAVNTCRMMRLEGLRFDSVTLASIMSASAGTSNLRLGLEGHCYCIRNNLDCDAVVASSIVDTYGKCGKIEYARRVFESATHRDIVLWNTMLAACAEIGLSGEALKLFYQMQLEGIPPNNRSWNTVILGYMRNGLVSEAKDMFMQMQSSGIDPNLITWTTLISGLVQNGLGYDAIFHFQRMQELGIRPNIITITSVLSACTLVTSLWYGRAVHGHIMRNRLCQSNQIATSLVDMYAKCGCLTHAERVFRLIAEPQLSLYNAMISCYALHGEAAKALELFKHLQEEDVKVDGSTLTSILSACCHAGLVDEGLELFVDMITKCSLKPSLEHYGCVVSLLSRCGQLDEALKILSKMPFEPDGHIVGSLLAASQLHGTIELTEILSQTLLKLESDNSGNYVALANAYASAEWWSEASTLRDKMKDKGLRKIPGRSWIQIGDEIHTFAASDSSHSEIYVIQLTLGLLLIEMKPQRHASMTCDTETFYA